MENKTNKTNDQEKDGVFDIEDVKISKKSYEIRRDRGIDDKDLVIIVTGVIAVCAMFLIPNPINLLSSIISGLFGLASGISISKK